MKMDRLVVNGRLRSSWLHRKSCEVAIDKVEIHTLGFERERSYAQTALSLENSNSKTGNEKYA